MKPQQFLFFIMLMACASVVNAQQWSAGVRGGISIPNLTAGGSEENPINTGYSSRLGPDFAIFAAYSFTKLFSLQAMVQYSSQGGKKDGLQAFTTPDQLAAMFPAGQVPPLLYANYKSEAKLNYLMIPVLAKFTWKFNNSPFYIYVDAGPFIGFLLNAKQVTSGQSEFFLDPAGQQPLPGGPQSFDNEENIKDQLQHVNFGVEGNLGLRYQFGSSAVFIEGGGNYGFINIQKGSENGKNNTGAATADIGYSYWFGK